MFLKICCFITFMFVQLKKKLRHINGKKKQDLINLALIIIYLVFCENYH